MRRFGIFFVLLTFIFTACSGSGAPALQEEEKPPEEAPPAVSPEEPYKGGFTKEQRVSDANMIIGMLERSYAPRDWKEEFLGLSFMERSKEFLDAASAEISDLDFYASIAKYLSGFHDGHISYEFPSTAVASLPLLFDDIEGRIIVTAVSDSIADKSHVGDELVEYNGQPAAEVRDSFLPYVGAGNPRSELRIATWMLADLYQKEYPYLPSEATASLKLRPQSGDAEYTVELEWYRSGNELAPFNDEGVDLSKGDGLRSQTSHPEISFIERIQKREAVKLRRLLLNNGRINKPFFPLDDSFVERKAAPYYSGVLQEGGRKIGFIRIHTFSSEDIDFNEALAELEEEISYYEQNTDALILDIANNPGGDSCYLTVLASLFLDKPFDETPNQFRANRAILNDIEEVINNEDASEDAKGIAAKIAEGIRSSLESGSLLTEPFTTCHLDGKYDPYTTADGAQITYTKPVLMLINELSASGGDYFPALMKDLGRATTFGANTLGAGGPVIEFGPSLGYSESLIRFTIGLGYRSQTITTPDGKETHYIENVGVSPDIPYEITLDDFMSGYQFYRDAVIQAALGLIEGQNSKGDEK